MGTTFLLLLVQGRVEGDHYSGSGHMWNWRNYLRVILASFAFVQEEVLFNPLPLFWMPHFHPSPEGYVFYYLKAEVGSFKSLPH